MPQFSTALNVYFSFIAAVLGAVFGSFLNCFAIRYSKGESAAKGRSHCVHCGHTLSAKDLVPVFGFMLLGGKCRYCRQKLSAAYVAAELTLAAAFVAVFLRYGISIECLKYLLLTALLFTAALTDIYCGLIPDRVIILAVAAAFVFALFPAVGTVPSSLLQTLIGGLSVSLPLLLIVLLFDKIMKRETMGGGDIKLMFAIGLYFHWSLNILTIIFACALGLVYALILQTASRRKAGKQTTDENSNAKAQKGGTFAFGPALCAACFIVMLFGKNILNWYFSLFAF